MSARAEQLGSAGVIPVVVVDDADDAAAPSARRWPAVASRRSR